MNIYQEASKMKLRIQTTKGFLSVEQLWDLPLTTLSTAIRSIKTALKKTDDDELSFLDETKKGDPENELRFEILKDVYLTKKKEAEDARRASEVKAHNQKIIALIQQKKEKDLEGKTIEELEAMLQ